jgi:translation elongation factor EF-4
LLLLLFFLLVCHAGYLVCGMKDTADARVGDTLVDPLEKDVVPLPGFQPVKAMLFSSVYPVNAAEFDDLRQALDRLVLNDSSVTVQVESSSALGQGFRCGFLGKLHMEVFHQRLNDEHGRTCFFAGEGWGEGRRISGSLIFFLLLVVVVVVVVLFVTEQVIATAPMVPFEAHMVDGSVIMVEKPSEMAPLLGM